MIKILLNAWKDPVWSKLISAGLLVLFGALGTWIFSFWPEIKQILLCILYFSTYEVGVPVWLILVTAPVLIGLVPFLKIFEKDSEPEFLKYKNDNILGIEWHWRWSLKNKYSNEYSVRDLHPRCPNCKSRPELNDYSGKLVNCINDECNWQWQQHDSFYNRISHSSDLNQKVCNVIDRKIHNGEFKA